MKELKGRVAVVTGGASGIGLAMAQRFAREGMKLVLADIEAGPLAAAEAALRAGGTEVVSRRADVMSGADVDALADAAYAAFGAVHVLCNNAGAASCRACSRPVTKATWSIPHRSPGCSRVRIRTSCPNMRSPV